VLRVSLARDDPAWRKLLPQAASRLRAAARQGFLAAWGAGWRGSNVSHECAILLTDDRRMQELNLRWRGQDKPTDVLSFAVLDSGRPSADLPWSLGDVVLASGAIGAEAAKRRRSFAGHALHATVHGMLHLLGYDHATRAQARAMERLEVSALAAMGQADPYR
jgi:probable rRNA maturation factor